MTTVHHLATEKPRNIFTDIQIANDTMLVLLSPKTDVTIENIKVGDRAVSYIHTDTGELGAKEFIQSIAETYTNSLTSKFLKKGYILVTQDTNSFTNILIKEREITLIFLSVGPITIDSVEGKDGSVFITREVSTKLMRTLTEIFEVKFDSDQGSGIFITVLRS